MVTYRTGGANPVAVVKRPANVDNTSVKVKPIRKWCDMPISKKTDGWYWGSKGPFATKQKAIDVGRAAHASGYKEGTEMFDKTATAEFVGTMLHSATLAHFKHFQVEGVGSDAAHRALEAYYDAIPDLVDAVTESIQGAYEDLVAPYPSAFANVDRDALEYIRGLRDYVRQARKSLPQDSEIQNEIDGIATLLNRTTYRLRFLK